MSHPARVSLRAPPHLPFIQGFPGIPGGGSRRPPGVHGTVEVRVGAVPIKAKWVRVEIRKHETIPPGFKTSGSSEEKTTWEHVGEIETLWKPSNPNKEFDVLETADFKFFLPLAENIPPSVNMMKDSGIRYELVAAVCYKQKGGMFKKELSSVIKTTEELRITKHELNSAWPLYNQPDSFNAAVANGQISMTVQRPYSAFGPNDRLLLTAVLRSNQPKPFRVKGFECTLLEVVTVTQITPHGDKRKSKKSPPSTTKSRTVATARYPIDETIGKGGEKSARMDIAMTGDKLLVTVRNGRTIEVGYELEVKAVCESVPEIAIRGIKYIVGPYSRAHSQQAVRDIGPFPPLCPAPPAPHSSNPPSSRPGSPTNMQSRASPPAQSPPRTFTPNGSGSRDLGQPDFPPGFSGHPLSRPPVQGFVPSPMNDRRKSSSTITTTTTTHDFGGPSMSQQGNRAYSTMPSASQRNSMPVAMPYQNGNLLRTPSYGSSINTPPSPHVESSGNQFGQAGGEPDEYRSKRYSSMTTGTFGLRDRDQLESLAEHDQFTTSAPSSNGTRTPRGPASASGDSHRTPPSAWLPAEQEKQRLYNEARARAANTQYQTGASMQDIGMDAPPDYDTPSRHTQVSAAGSSSSSQVVPAVVLSAAEEKEQQRKRYEEAQRTVSGSGSGSQVTPMAGEPGAGSGSGLGSASSKQPTYLSAAEEKEIQKKRFEEASARVGGAAPSTTAIDGGAGSTGMPWTHLSAAEEKELQRKRYEEASRRVGGGFDVGDGSMSSRAVSPAPTSMMNGGPSTPTPALGEQPVPYDAVFPPKSPALQQPVDSSSGRATPSRSGQTELSDKEAMNRYFYAKDRRGSRIVSNPSSSSPGPAHAAVQQPVSSSGTSTPPIAGSSTMALSGNEAMKRYYDQQARGDRSVASPIPKDQEAPPPFASGSARAMPMMSPSPAIDEKAQMKRYYEALERVNNAQSPGGSNDTRAPEASASRSSWDQPPPSGAPASPTPRASGSSSSQPQAYLSAAEEKEQMRKRFEQATAAVSRSQGLEAPPASSQANGSGSTNSAPPPSASGSAGQVPKAYLSAAEEKEQMRRRFEDATAAVNRQSTQPPPTPSPMSPHPYDSAPAASGSSSSQNAPAAYLSAAEEKEQMRRRFEDATAAVNRKSTQPPPGPPGTTDSPPRPTIVTAGASSSSTSRPPAPYLSAAEEKEQMRKRFEDATAAVHRNSAHPAPDSAPSRSFTSPPPPPPASAGPAQAGPSRQTTLPPSSRTSVPPRLDPDAPPPPLPARPPAEYINLLSPVDEGARPPWSLKESASLGMVASQSSAGANPK